MNLSNLPVKKIGLAALILIIAAGAGYGIYYLFFRQAAPVITENEATNEAAGGLPTGPAGGVTNQIVNGVPVNEALPGIPGIPKTITKVPAPTGISAIAAGGVTKVATNFTGAVAAVNMPAGQNNPLFYNPQDGYFYEISSFGTTTKKSNTSYPNAQNIAWASNGDKAILEFPDGSNILYDFKLQKQTSLPKSWQDFQFNDQGSKIAFKDINVNENYNWLAIADPDGSKQKYLETLGDRGSRVEINWSPTSNTVANYYKSENASSTTIYMIGQNEENFRAIDAKGQFVQSKWVPDGKRMVYSAYSAETDNKPNLYIVDAVGDSVGYNHNSLNLNTWIDKCVFQGESIMYCAVPKSLPSDAGFQPTIADTIPDYIYKIDLNTGSKVIIAEPEYSYTIQNMEISPDGKYLYFTDKALGQLHNIQLK
ncbi:MAG TPA: hypothetical protein VMX18_02340 [Candidatus Bipolaricaulota bacterium]|nr:hypothetical protein [Candidatus Bipolaricaulota bacterium]